MGETFDRRFSHCFYIKMKAESFAFLNFVGLVFKKLGLLN